jgi:dolichyl-phosphate beta-glucosyltransferase
MDWSVSEHGRERDQRLAEAPTLSVILPCYRARALAGQSVATLLDALARTDWSWEIIVVSDGDTTLLHEPPWSDARVRIIGWERNRGKGCAVAAGILAARGRVRLFTDVELPYGVDAIVMMTDLVLRHEYHLIIGDRNMPGSSFTDSGSLVRRLISRVGTAFIGALVTGGYWDTQCGIKAIRGDVAAHLMPLLRIRRFAFDVELIYCALKHRLEIKRIPVRLRHNGSSTVRPLRDSAQAAFDILRIKLNQMRGRYASTELDSLLQAEFARLQASAHPDRSRPVTRPLGEHVATASRQSRLGQNAD